MKHFIKWILGLGFLGAAAVLSWLLFVTKPVAEKKPQAQSVPVVEAMPVAFGEVRVQLPSQGLVEARQRTRLAAEVSGRIVWVSPRFKAGNFFAEDDSEPMLRIDPADYEAEEARASAALADARLELATERARAEQALRDWEALKLKGEAGELTRREPHLASAEAAVAAAEAALAKAKRDRERTEIRAPFSGRLASTSVELGAFVSPGTVLAEIYSQAPHEIRLPLSLDDWALLDRNGAGEAGGSVRFRARTGVENHEWTGRIIRTEGEVERDSRSIYVVAEIEAAPNDALLQPGLFLQATISGKTLPRVARVPFRAFLDLERVAVVTLENQIQVRAVEVLRRAGDEALVSAGLEPGERVCVTQISDLVDNMEVDPRLVDPPAPLTGDAEWTSTKP